MAGNYPIGDLKSTLASQAGMAGQLLPIGIEALYQFPPEADQPLAETVGWIEGNLFYRFDKLTTGRRISSRRGVGLFP